MSLPVLTAVTGDWEAALVTGLERCGAGGQVRVARRCADLGELLAAAAAGLGRAALLSADLHRLDRDALARLADAGLAVVGVCDPRQPADADRLRALGVAWTIPADAPAAAVVTALTEAAAELALLPGRRAAVSPGAPSAPAGPGGAPPIAGVPGEPAGPPPPGPVPPGAGSGGVVAVWGPAGAPGRTTVAVTLAAELARLGHSVLLVDADTYGACVAQTLGLLDESAGLAAAVRAATGGSLDADRLARLAPVVLPGLRVLTGLPRPARWPELKSAGLDVVWEFAREVARWTVVDCGFCLEADEELSHDLTAPRRNAATLSALAAADVVLAVGTADPVGLQRLVRGLSDLEEATGRTDGRVVVTRVRDEAIGPAPERRVIEVLGRFAGVRSAVLVPEDREALDGALLAGRSLTEHAPESPARLALARLAGELAGVAAPNGTRRRRRRWLRS